MSSSPPYFPIITIEERAKVLLRALEAAGMVKPTTSSQRAGGIVFMWPGLEVHVVRSFIVPGDIRCYWEKTGNTYIFNHYDHARVIVHVQQSLVSKNLFIKEKIVADMEN
jgi:hypothetical protein